MEMAGERLCVRHPAERLGAVGGQLPVAAPVLEENMSEHFDKCFAATVIGRVERLAEGGMAARKGEQERMEKVGGPGLVRPFPRVSGVGKIQRALYPHLGHSER